jgi:Spy/CpxP family protein refolding chaperone
MAQRRGRWLRLALGAVAAVAAVAIGAAAAQAPAPSDNAPAELERRFDLQGADAGHAGGLFSTDTDAGFRGENF